MRFKLSKPIVMVAVLFAATMATGFVVAQASNHRTVTAASSHVVQLLSDHASPSVIAITKGDYVQFSSRDGQVHNIGQGKGDDEVHQQAHADTHDHTAGGKESGNFGAGEAYRVQFNQTGTYSFHDHLHPKISVTVVVYEQHVKP